MRRSRVVVITAALAMAATSAWGQTSFKDVVALDFSKKADQDAKKITLNGAAKWADSSSRPAAPTPRLRLTDGVSQAASAFVPTPMGLSDYQVVFDFQIQRAAAGQIPADGFTFAAQSVGPTALGGTGDGLGYLGSGLSTAGYAYALEFNTYPPNGLPAADGNPASPETVALNLSIPGTHLGDSRIRLNQTPVPLVDQGVIHAVIRVAPATITASFTGGDVWQVLYEAPPWLGGTLFKPFDGTGKPLPLFIGVTGSTGAAQQVVDILNFRVQVPG